MGAIHQQHGLMGRNVNHTAKMDLLREMWISSAPLHQLWSNCEDRWRLCQLIITYGEKWNMGANQRVQICGDKCWLNKLLWRYGQDIDLNQLGLDFWVKRIYVCCCPRRFPYHMIVVCLLIITRRVSLVETGTVNLSGFIGSFSM